ncbi:TPA: 2,3-bisphosphoglycerate-independent phosphoglycerate mutase [Candidatus Dependentiae bacterium]|nr:MAG: 2,3-bisphosphoglycerate-independent phosphoglycerate mutase [candidate division TM6 bacterium GW2011_GWF2_43_87]HBL98049.1 2,3-bisphosphoglycerate-independent phosphoglycerate mutase [Candidatus Dependentiae bacterium]
MKHPLALVILDGWGYSTSNTFNAIHDARPTTFNTLIKSFPHTLLKASGPAVGLPENFTGNSEVGHLTIGAGRRIPQLLTLINNAIADESFFKNPQLTEKFKQLTETGGALHLIGLVSNGGVHSYDSHLDALIKLASEYKLKKVYIHAILDGRDTPPQSASTFLEQLEDSCALYEVGSIASLSGRWYAMDRDENWDRTLQAYTLLTQSRAATPQDWRTVIKTAYEKNVSDEFIPPAALEPFDIKPEDGLLFFNFRPDRIRQLTSLVLGIPLPLKNKPFSGSFPAKLPCAFVISFGRYHTLFTNEALFEKKQVEHTLLDALETAKKRSFVIAETEKYAHVTYFFSGGNETAHQHETRVLVPSLAVKSYEQVPAMSAEEITKQVVKALVKSEHEFFLINYANADMVGHTGNYKSTIEAIHAVDQQLAVLWEEIVNKRQGILLITADHGNAEEMVDLVTDTPKTSHTINPVPFIGVGVVGKEAACICKMSELADIAPFVLELLHAHPPKEMAK